VRGPAPMRFAGLDLAERGVRIARRAGIEHVAVVVDDRPFADAPFAELLLVIPERVIVEPALLRELVQRSLRSPEDAVVLADAEGRSTDLMLLSLSATERVRSVPRVRSALRRLAVESTVRVVRSRERFCVRLSDARDLPCVEARYLRHTNGGDG